MRRIWPLVLAAWLCAPVAAQAGTITIEYTLLGSSVDILGGGVVIPPEGSIAAGSLRLALPGSALDSPSAGPVTLSDLLLDVDIDGDILGNAITGSVDQSQMGTTAGSLDAALSTVTFPNPLVMSASGSVACSGPDCAAIGSFPVDISSPQIAPVFGSYAISGLATVGGASFEGLLSGVIEGFATDFAFVGTEVSRSFVPEPGVGTLLALGLAGLAGLRRRDGGSAP